MHPTATLRLVLFLVLLATYAKAQVSVSDDSTVSADGSAIFELNVTGSAQKGMLLTRMTQAQRLAITTPANGLLVYQTDSEEGLYVYNGADWLKLVTSAGNNSTTPTPAPTITSINPSSGSTGTLVTVVGSNFSENPSVPNEVILAGPGGQTRATVTYSQAQGLIFRTPTGLAPGPYTVRCVVGGQTADFASYTIVAGGTVTTVAGNDAFGFRDGLSGQAVLNTPTGMAAFGGELYFCDQNNGRIRKYNPTTGIVSTVVGTTFSTPVDGPVATARLSNPIDLCIDASGTIYWVEGDFSSPNLVRKLSSGVVSTIAGSSRGYIDGNVAIAEFNVPSGIAVNAAGTEIYVADAANSCIRLIAGSNVSTFAGTNSQGFADDVLANARFNQPNDVILTPSGDLIVCDPGNNRIRLISLGNVSTIAGVGTAGFLDGDVATARFEFPYSVFQTSTGDILVTDAFSRIRRISGSNVSTVSGTGELARLDGPISEAKFYAPYGITVLGTAIYVTERNSSTLRRIDE
jgi:hypothetical protein